jgi:hypothetical protein
LFSTSLQDSRMGTVLLRKGDWNESKETFHHK